MAFGDRRALEQVHGPVQVKGDLALAEVLSEAWDRASQEDPDTLTHGFHSWPARMHSALPRTILAHLGPRNVVDPFCGGGTVLVEAMVAGCRSLGVDLDPLAPLLVDVKTDVRTEAELRAFVEAAEEVAARSEARVRGRVRIAVSLPRDELRWYAPHVLKELGGLLEEIRAVPDRRDRRALAMVFSSIVVKVSRQLADTSEEETERRIRKGLSTEIFLRKARELADRWGSLAELASGPKPEVVQGDARDLPQILGERRAALILTSPPYGGTYDYATHHARRAAWLHLDASPLREGELGARRHLAHERGERAWEAEVDGMLEAFRAALRPDGHVVLVMGDGVAGGARVPLLPQLARLAPRRGLALVAAASQPRLDWRGGRPREEHLVLLGALRSDAPRAGSRPAPRAPGPVPGGAWSPARDAPRGAPAPRPPPRGKR